jgi:hypothetical protein
MGKMYKSMQGKQVDMEKLMSANELMPAIGNVKVNARGDELGPGGKIIKKREDVMAEYYENNPKAIPEAPRPVQTKVVETVAEVVAAPSKKK